MNAVSAADRRRVLKFTRPARQDLFEFLQAFENDPRRFFDLERLGGIHHVIGGKTVVQPARLGADLFRHRGSEGDHVVLYVSFNLVDALQFEIAALGDGLGSLLGDDSGLGEREAGGDFHLKPAAEFIFITPDAAHFRAGITRDQRPLLQARRNAGRPPIINAVCRLRQCFLFGSRRAATDSGPNLWGDLVVMFSSQ